MLRRHIKQLLLAALVLFPSATLRAAADSSSALFHTLRSCDSLLFSVGYNRCDVRPFDSLISDDFEFYHDEAGITRSKTAFIEGIRSGLCTLPYKPYRELDGQHLRAYPLEKNGRLYGAVQTGVHRFYAKEPGKPDRPTSVAKFTHIWLLESGRWKLSRAFSYDHH